MSRQTFPVGFTPAHRLRRSALVLAGLVISAGVSVYVRLYRLDGLNYWFDESFTLKMSTFEFREMVVRCRADAHPPFFFLSLKWWIAIFGDAPWTTRFFSVLWSVAAVLATYGFIYEACQQGGEAEAHPRRAIFAATVGALCMALSPLQITWAQQVRMYCAVSFFAVISTWFLWRAFQKPERTGRWMAYALAELLGIYTHITLTFVFMAHMLGALLIVLQSRRRSALDKTTLKGLLSSGGLIALFSVPWMLIVRLQHQRVQTDFWIMPFSLDLLGKEIQKCFTVYQRPIGDTNISLWVLQGIILLLLYVASRGRPFHLLVASAAALPFVMLILISVVDVNIIDARYFISGHALVCVAVGAAMYHVPTNSLRLALSLCFLAPLSFFASRYHAWLDTSAGHQGLPGLMTVWREYRADAEPLVYCSPKYFITGSVYADPGEPVFTQGEIGDYPFYKGTAVLSSDDFISADSLDRLNCHTIWACDCNKKDRFLKPVALSDRWVLVDEIVVRDYSIVYFLRRYHRAITDQHVTENSIQPAK